MEMIEQVKAAFQDSMKDFTEKMKAMMDGEVKPLSENVTKLAERVEKIERLPIQDKGVNVNFFSENYKGRNLNEMGLKLAEKAAKNPHRFTTFSNPQKFYEYKKWMIDAALALKRRDGNAMQALFEAQQKASMNETTGSQGAYAVPIDYEWDIIQLVREDSPLLEEVTRFPMSTKSVLMPKEATLVSVYWIDEAADKTESSPTLGQLELVARKLCGLTEPMSDEFIEDAAMDIPSWLTEQFAYATRIELENQILNGTGIPTSGVLTAAAGYSVVLGAGLVNFSSVTAATLLAATRKLSAKDRANAKWAFGKDVAFYLQGLNDTTGRPLWSDGIQGSRPTTLWGYPVIETANAPAEAASGTGKGFAVLGDFRQFYLGVRKGTFTLDVDPYSYFRKDQTRFRMVTRWAPAIARNTAFVRIVTA